MNRIIHVICAAPVLLFVSCSHPQNPAELAATPLTPYKRFTLIAKFSQAEQDASTEAIAAAEKLKNIRACLDVLNTGAAPAQPKAQPQAATRTIAAAVARTSPPPPAARTAPVAAVSPAPAASASRTQPQSSPVPQKTSVAAPKPPVAPADAGQRAARSAETAGFVRKSEELEAKSLRELALHASSAEFKTLAATSRALTDSENTARRQFDLSRYNNSIRKPADLPQPATDPKPANRHE